MTARGSNGSGGPAPLETVARFSRSRLRDSSTGRASLRSLSPSYSSRATEASRFSMVRVNIVSLFGVPSGVRWFDGSSRCVGRFAIRSRSAVWCYTSWERGRCGNGTRTPTGGGLATERGSGRLRQGRIVAGTPRSSRAARARTIALFVFQADGVSQTTRDRKVKRRALVPVSLNCSFRNRYGGPERLVVPQAPLSIPASYGSWARGSPRMPLR